MRQEKGFKFFLNTKNNKAHPLDLAYLERLECLNVIIATQFATNEQLKDLIHMFCLRISCYKLYKKRFVLLCSHIKIHVSFWDEF
jgi:hypothetical protein